MNTEQKIARLILLVNEYLKYTVWTNVGVTIINDDIYVTWYSPVDKDDMLYLQTSIRKFPVEDLDDLIVTKLITRRKKSDRNTWIVMIQKNEPLQNVIR